MLFIFPRSQFTPEDWGCGAWSRLIPSPPELMSFGHPGPIQHQDIHSVLGQHAHFHGPSAEVEGTPKGIPSSAFWHLVVLPVLPPNTSFASFLLLVIDDNDDDCALNGTLPLLQHSAIPGSLFSWFL